MKKWIKNVVAGIMLSGAAAGAGDFFFCSFEEMSAVNGDQKITPVIRGEYRTVTGFKDSSQGAVFAMENLPAFQKHAKMSPLAPRPAIIYSGLKGFPAEKGYCELWIAPFFNQEHAYRGNPDKKLRLSYVFSLFTHKPGTSQVARSGKSAINVYIMNRRLTAQLAFTDGSSAMLGTSLAKWEPGKFHKVTLCWEPGVQQLYIDGKLVREIRKKGTLAPFNSLEIGGRDVSLSFQGIIDDFRIAPGKPADLALPAAK